MRPQGNDWNREIGRKCLKIRSKMSVNKVEVLNTCDIGMYTNLDFSYELTYNKLS